MFPTTKKLLAFCVSVIALSSCVSSDNSSILLNTEPEIGSVLPVGPRTLRLYFSSFPLVASSQLKLLGPAGEVDLRGLHTMSANDLMIEIVDVLSDGMYTVEWETTLAENPTPQTGSFIFTVDRP